MKTVIIIDNGHGVNTPGKCSPKWHGADGYKMYEFEFARDVAKRIKKGLNANGIEAVLLVPELEDITLEERIRRERKLFKKYADAHGGNTILLSIHGNGGKGTGWEAWTTRDDTEADPIATILYKHAERLLKPHGFPVRKDSRDGDPDKEADWYMCKHSYSPAVLTENLFQDTKKDCDFMNSNLGRDIIAKIHIDAILEVVNG